MAVQADPHLNLVRPVTRTPEGCEECLMLGQRRATQPGDILFREGDRNCDFFVVVAGKVAAVEGHGTLEEHVISVHRHGRSHVHRPGRRPVHGTGRRRNLRDGPDGGHRHRRQVPPA